MLLSSSTPRHACLAAGLSDGSVVLWNLPQMEVALRFHAHAQLPITSLDWSTCGPAAPGTEPPRGPDGTMEARVWRTDDGALAEPRTSSAMRATARLADGCAGRRLTY